MYNIYATNENENGESENAMWATLLQLANTCRLNTIAST